MAFVIAYILLITVSFSWGDEPNVITDDDERILLALNTTFRELYDQEKVDKFKQFAVLYYGSGGTIDNSLVTDACKSQTENKQVFLDFVNKNFDVSKCTFIAGKLKFGEIGSHSEKFIFESLQRTGGQVCPGAKNKNIYLYTYNSPCVNCKDFITDFINKCADKKEFNRLIVGYSQDWTGVDDVKETIRTTANVAIKKLE